jgi:hypothetical protein
MRVTCRADYVENCGGTRRHVQRVKRSARTVGIYFGLAGDDTPLTREERAAELSQWAHRPMTLLVLMALGKGAVSALALGLMAALVFARSDSLSTHATRALGVGLLASAVWLAALLWVRHAARRGRRSWVLGPDPGVRE